MMLVTGATGKIGREVMARLVEVRADVRALVRDPARAAAAPWAARATLVEGDLRDEAALGRALDGATQLFLLTPANTQLELQIVERAARAGVKHVVKISALSAAADAPFPMARGHAAVEAKLAALGLAATVIRPGMFAQNLLQFAGQIQATGQFQGAYGKGKVAPVDVRDIADVAVAALTAPTQHDSLYQLTGPEALSFEQMAAKLSAATGREVRYVNVSTEVLRQSMAPQLEAAGFPPVLLEELLARQVAIAAGGGAEVHGDVARVMNRPPRSFDEFARDHADAFRGR